MNLIDRLADNMGRLYTEMELHYDKYSRWQRFWMRAAFVSGLCFLFIIAVLPHLLCVYTIALYRKITGYQHGK